MKKDVFTAGMALLAATFDRKVTDDLGRAYWMALGEHFTDDQWQHAVSRACRELKFWPKPVELLEMIHGNLADTAELAWMTVTQAVEAVGAYRTANFDDPLINATIRALGGWVAVCDTPAAEFDKWTRKEFLRVYGSLARSQGMSDEATKALPGIHDRTNAIVSPGYGVKVVRVACNYLNGKPKRIENAQN